MWNDFDQHPVAAFFDVGQVEPPDLDGRLAFDPADLEIHGDTGVDSVDRYFFRDNVVVFDQRSQVRHCNGLAVLTLDEFDLVDLGACLSCVQGQHLIELPILEMSHDRLGSHREAGALVRRR